MENIVPDSGSQVVQSDKGVSGGVASNSYLNSKGWVEKTKMVTKRFQTLFKSLSVGQRIGVVVLMLVTAGLGTTLALVKVSQDVRQRASENIYCAGVNQCLAARHTEGCCPGLVEVEDNSCRSAGSGLQLVSNTRCVEPAPEPTPTPPPVCNNNSTCDEGEDTTNCPADCPDSTSQGNLPLGSDCSDSVECQSGTCSNGVCVDATSSTTCAGGEQPGGRACSGYRSYIMCQEDGAYSSQSWNCATGYICSGGRCICEVEGECDNDPAQIPQRACNTYDPVANDCVYRANVERTDCQGDNDYYGENSFADCAARMSQGVDDRSGVGGYSNLPAGSACRESLECVSGNCQDGWCTDAGDSSTCVKWNGSITNAGGCDNRAGLIQVCRNGAWGDPVADQCQDYEVPDETNPTLAPSPISSGKCYFGVSDCSLISRHSSNDCNSSCPVGSASCCGAEITKSDQVCNPGYKSCSAGVLTRCNDNGQGFSSNKCPSGRCNNDGKSCRVYYSYATMCRRYLPLSNSCQIEFDVDRADCLGENDYYGESSAEACAARINQYDERICEPGTTSCSQGVLTRCNDDGLGVSDEDCPSGRCNNDGKSCRVYYSYATMCRRYLPLSNSCQIEFDVDRADCLGENDYYGESSAEACAARINQHLESISLDDSAHENDASDLSPLIQNGQDCGGADNGEFICLDSHQCVRCNGGRWENVDLPYCSGLRQNAEVGSCGSGTVPVASETPTFSSSCEGLHFPLSACPDGCSRDRATLFGSCGETENNQVGNNNGMIKPDSGVGTDEGINVCEETHFGFFSCPAECSKNIVVGMGTCGEREVSSQTGATSGASSSGDMTDSGSIGQSSTTYENGEYNVRTGDTYSQLDYGGELVCDGVSLSEAGCGVFVTASLLGMTPQQAAEFYCPGGPQQVIANGSDEVNGYISAQGTDIRSIRTVLERNGATVGSVQRNMNENYSVEEIGNEMMSYANQGNTDVVVTIDHAVGGAQGCRLIGHQIIVHDVSRDENGNFILNSNDSIYQGDWRMCDETDPQELLRNCTEGCAIVKNIFPVQNNNTIGSSNTQL